MTKINFSLLLLGVFVTVAVIAFWGNAPQTSPLPLQQATPLTSFTLIDTAAKPFSFQQLEGKVSVVNFIFTSCPDFCPRLSTAMSQLEKQFKEKEVQFISITVDPHTDTPQILSEYAQRFHADINRWHFLTGESDDIKKLLIEGFKIGSPADPLAHSDRFVLVDDQLNILNYYSFSDAAQMDRLPNDIFHALSRVTAKK
ncbi:MAG: hypothetical protein A3I05_02115 [Deltaproteobacteria bacterium RIFCSPLOWO2_02_FULL_44_10]|nr:MAG: hypothetical protein A3C46_08285 [Deltaproteobacteria bacterium RIFCSPHIGHO2_02_FULL_44_16]OGQ47573.1 MAG: hypothetical protein A3I05_02115 [Deltaproteobacteria bacterium RIFCSPLOWO2_02_FULL_44_10]